MISNTINSKLLTDILSSARARDYKGYSKFDALNSNLLDRLSFNNKWLKILYTQLIKECPVNIRPFLRVKKSRNPKGIALFARAYLTLYEISRDPEFLSEAEKLLQWLMNNRSPGQSHLCWGYNYVWQSTLFLQEKYEPNAVVTTFCGEAFVQAHRVTGKINYLEAAKSVAQFILEDLPVLYESENERAIAYVLRDVSAIVLNNQVLTGAFLIKVWKATGDDKILDIASRQMRYTLNRSTDYHAWYYTYPADKSLITHDNYHTGGILDGILEFMEATGDNTLQDVFRKGLSYYQKHLFEPDGAPRWMNNKRFPQDIHGAAQGIITFAKASLYDPKLLEMAEKIARWSIRALYRPETKDFAYRQGRYIKWNYSLMRWCNGWMARALSELLFHHRNEYAADRTGTGS